MRISLLNGGTQYHLAGQAGVSERVHSSAGGFSMDPSIATEPVQLVRGTNAKENDRGNLLNTISFSTTRMFSTVWEAQRWCLLYDTTSPRTGALYMDSVKPDGSVVRTAMANALVRPPGRIARGASITLRYTVTGGAISTPTAASVIINPAGADNSALYTAVNTGTIGHNITMAYAISGVGSAVISIVVTGTAIVVTAGSATTAATVIAAVNADPAAAALVTAAASGPDTGAVAAVAATNLTGGTD